jgi:transketolase
VVEVSDAKIRELEDKARLLRRHILKMTHQVQSGHPGGSMSACDIVTALYFDVLRVDPDNPTWPDRDRFVLSKGHACPVLYAALAERGFFPVKELMTFRRINSRLQGHPELGTTPGIENAAGAEGQGLSFGVGLGLAARLDRKAWRVYCLLGDGEQDVGQTWEAALAGAKYHLDNLTAFIDRNGIQQEGRTEEIMPIEPLADKWEAFGWNVLTINGHDMRQILEGIDEAQSHKGQPTVIIAKTTKGKGVSFMENVVRYHGAATSDEELKRALAELGEAIP